MDKTMGLKEFLYNLGKDKLCQAVVPLGFTAGFPIIQIKEKRVLLKVPFYRADKNAAQGTVAIFPIRFTLTYSWPEANAVSFDDLAYVPLFSKLSFGRPLSLSPRKSAQDKERQEALFGLYDQLLAFILEGGAFTPEDEAAFGALLNACIEPSLLPMYRHLDAPFAKKFLLKKEGIAP